MMGYTRRGAPEVFPFRPAPLQVRLPAPPALCSKLRMAALPAPKALKALPDGTGRVLGVGGIDVLTPRPIYRRGQCGEHHHQLPSNIIAVGLRILFGRAVERDIEGNEVGIGEGQRKGRGGWGGFVAPSMRYPAFPSQ